MSLYQYFGIEYPPVSQTLLIQGHILCPGSIYGPVLDTDTETVQCAHCALKEQGYAQHNLGKEWEVCKCVRDTLGFRGDVRVSGRQRKKPRGN